MSRLARMSSRGRLGPSSARCVRPAVELIILLVGVQHIAFVQATTLESGGSTNTATSWVSNGGQVTNKLVSFHGAATDNTYLYVVGKETRNKDVINDVTTDTTSGSAILVSKYATGDTAQVLATARIEDSATEWIEGSAGGKVATMGQYIVVVYNMRTAGTASISHGVVTQFNATDLSKGWTASLNTHSVSALYQKHHFAMGVATAGEGASVWVCGYVEEDSSDRNSFVAELSSTGTMLRAAVTGTVGMDRAEAVFVYDGYVYVAGATMGDMDGPGNGAQKIVVEDDSYIHKFKASGASTNAPLVPVLMYQAAMDGSANSLTSLFIDSSGVFAAGRADIGVRSNIFLVQLTHDLVTIQSQARLTISSTSGKTESLITGIHADSYAVYVTGSTTVVINGYGLTEASALTGTTETFVAMMEKSDFSVERWYRYAGTSASTETWGFACDALSCYSVGSHVSTAGFMESEVMRTAKCPPGTRYATTKNAIQPSDRCWDCAAGTYQANAGASECFTCGPGTFADTTKATSCKQCAAGFYQPLSGQASCLPCPAGSYSPSAGATSCVVCPAGTYNNAEGQSVCTNCAAGQYSTLTNQTTNVCLDCAVGNYSLPGSAICSFCPGGTYQNETGKGFCHECPIGFELDALGGQSKSQCVPCRRGTYATAAGAKICTLCPPGTAQNLTGQFNCTACDRGHYAGSGFAVCEPCPKGTYTALNSTVSCFDCRPGTYANETGSTACIRCPANTYTKTRAAAECTACPENSESEAGSPMLGSCGCSPGYFGNPGKNRECIQCPPGATCNSKQLWPSVSKGNWIRSDDPYNIKNCVPTTACPGGDVAYDSNATSYTVSFGIEGEGLRAMAVSSGGDGAGQSVMSSSTVTSLCESGYAGEACSECDTDFYRNKGSCIACPTAVLPEESIYVFLGIGIVVVAWAIIALSCAVGCYKVRQHQVQTRKQRKVVLQEAEQDDIAPPTLDSMACSVKPIMMDLGSTKRIPRHVRQNSEEGLLHSVTEGDDDISGHSPPESNRVPSFTSLKHDPRVLATPPSVAHTTTGTSAPGGSPEWQPSPALSSSRKALSRMFGKKHDVSRIPSMSPAMSPAHSDESSEVSGDRFVAHVTHVKL